MINKVYKTITTHCPSQIVNKSLPHFSTREVNLLINSSTRKEIDIFIKSHSTSRNINFHMSYQGVHLFQLHMIIIYFYYNFQVRQ